MKEHDANYYVIEFRLYSANVVCFENYKDALEFFNANAVDKNWVIINGMIVKEFEDESK